MCQIGVVQRRPGSKLEFLHFVAQWHSVTVAQWHQMRIGKKPWLSHYLCVQNGQFCTMMTVGLVWMEARCNVGWGFWWRLWCEAEVDDDLPPKKHEDADDDVKLVSPAGGWASCSQAGSFSSKSPHQPPLDLARITRQTWPGWDFH